MKLSGIGHSSYSLIATGYQPCEGDLDFDFSLTIVCVNVLFSFGLVFFGVLTCGWTREGTGGFLIPDETAAKNWVLLYV